MRISVVIPVSNDLRLINCIESIDESVEVVISLNKASKDIKKLVKNILNNQEFKKFLKIVVCEIKEASIAEAYNNGIKHSSYSKILLMDSDCTFGKETIKKLNNNLGNNFLSKGRVFFKSNSWISHIIARAREYHTSDKVNAYSPPLLFSKKIINYIGGYYFHPKLCWSEDSEFDLRVKKAGLEISYDPTAVVYHPTLSLWSDLKSSFWYGVGRRIGLEVGVRDKPVGVFGSFRKYVGEASKEKGLLVGIYLFIWKMSTLLGYYVQEIFRLKK
ncbi:MAG: hypothetical protein US95_C0035G0008 [Candidatus Woesebacteria bacterium GW2011_GWB1_38_5]|uniref:Glycosyltransferase 2-like domain-containing protein n=4 Tax=Candidatus Woeseibacteriota TaxID=1752722 RepID=A0A0G0NEP6_9BACT|nr:MAG: hypothetical protein US67_C0045G0003 [Candidatus Woesebacteria bacterium GW2011_GWD1_38_10]KKQ56164.1 MAG: hypothetical protein US75_C0009G0017 [Candidatus Woesebacteria bacterium GW2011_GWC1_38_13]KKQ74081.1 MAG: hypothetical protein US95_C0035G0008 [Candidatus Woesebacteria bacterium GW2011_GWB1_38_5]KKQ84374.1 MAG: hypothetical protein UT06_C0005G0033 [Candidatus Woesebacteria bacterium GW2011_GWA1_38_8]